MLSHWWGHRCRTHGSSLSPNPRGFQPCGAYRTGYLREVLHQPRQCSPIRTPRLPGSSSHMRNLSGCRPRALLGTSDQPRHDPFATALAPRRASVLAHPLVWASQIPRQSGRPPESGLSDTTPVYGFPSICLLYLSSKLNVSLLHGGNPVQALRLRGRGVTRYRLRSHPRQALFRLFQWLCLAGARPLPLEARQRFVTQLWAWVWA